MNEMIYTYDGSFDGLLSCIFDSYAHKEIPTAITCGEEPVLTLFPVRSIPTDSGHAARVLRRLHQLSPYGEELVRRGYLTCMDDREIRLYRLVAKLLREGPGFLRDFSDETLHPVAAAVRHLNGEAHLLKGFLRFSELGGVLGSEIEPKNRVLPILRSHFCARYQNEKFFIYDRTHREALFYAAGKAVIRPLANFQMAPPDETEARYRLLWKRFYDTVAIKERENPRLRMSNMPKRYWSTMTEFQDASWFTPAGSGAAVPAPGVPAGTPAPGTRPEPGLSAPASAL